MIEIYEYAKNQKDMNLIKAAFFVALGFLVKGLTIIAIGGMVALIFFLYQKKFTLFFAVPKGRIHQYTGGGPKAKHLR